MKRHTSSESDLQAREIVSIFEVLYKLFQVAPCAEKRLCRSAGNVKYLIFCETHTEAYSLLRRAISGSKRNRRCDPEIAVSGANVND